MIQMGIHFGSIFKRARQVLPKPGSNINISSVNCFNTIESTQQRDKCPMLSLLVSRPCHSVVDSACKYALEAMHRRSGVKNIQSSVVA